MSFLLKNWASLYANITPAERALEPALASLGVRYRVQHPIFALGYILDFVLPDHKLAIEVDDRSHRRASKKQKDAERTAKLQAKGWRVIRCTNEEAEAAPWDTVDRLMEQAGLPFRTNRGDC